MTAWFSSSHPLASALWDWDTGSLGALPLAATVRVPVACEMCSCGAGAGPTYKNKL